MHLVCVAGGGRDGAYVGIFFDWVGQGGLGVRWLLTWKTKVLEAKAFSAHLRRIFAQTKPLAFGRKNTNVIILKS
jgi:hypothetical protein